MNYKIISYQDWLDNYRNEYPYARASLDKREVVLSCTDGSGNMTAKEAKAYIRANWPTE